MELDVVAASSIVLRCQVIKHIHTVRIMVIVAVISAMTWMDFVGDH